MFREQKNIEVNDNKYNYDNKKMSAADHDHPLKAADFSFSNLSVSACNNEINEITSEINSVALDWKSLRNVTTCACSTPFDQFSKKVGTIKDSQLFRAIKFVFKFQTHCWKCGEVFCTRCIDKTAPLPGGSGNPVPVCRGCFKSVQPLSP